MRFLGKGWCVYKHTNKGKGKCYIGVISQQPDARWKGGEGYNPCRLFYRTIQKYSQDGFGHEVLYSGFSESDAKDLEISLIRQYRSLNSQYGHNFTNGEGGMFGYVMSDKPRLKLSIARTGKRCGGNSANYGKHPPEQTRKKTSESKQYTYHGDGNPFYGKHHTNETKKKISDTKLANGTPLDTPTICIGTGEIYHPMSEASRCHGCDASSIRRCCKGEYMASHGLHWGFFVQKGGD